MNKIIIALLLVTASTLFVQQAAAQTGNKVLAPIKYETNPNVKEPPMEYHPSNNTQSNQNINYPTPTNLSNSGCFVNMAVFGDIHYTNETKEYTWTIPNGVPAIKIEAWSGGGNGYDTIIYIERHAHDLNETLFNHIEGGGGGGGAYANTIIPVKTGDKIFISIPPGGGGKSVQVKIKFKCQYILFK